MPLRLSEFSEEFVQFSDYLLVLLRAIYILQSSVLAHKIQSAASATVALWSVHCGLSVCISCNVQALRHKQHSTGSSSHTGHRLWHYSTKSRDRVRCKHEAVTAYYAVEISQ
eukprot:6185956-Pleurochrysis_carterae.AAC.1